MRRKLKMLVVTYVLIIATTILAILPVESVEENNKDLIRISEIDLIKAHRDFSNLNELNTSAGVLEADCGIPAEAILDKKVEDCTEESEDTQIYVEERQYYDIPLSKYLQDKVSYYIDYMNIDLDESYFYALVYQESRFDSSATGSSGDSGYCQLLQKYFHEIYTSFKEDYPELFESEGFVYDIYDEKTNLACGIYWLDKCAKRISGEGLSRNNLSSALTSYNRGVNGAKNYFENNKTYVTKYSSKIIEVAQYIQQTNSIPN